MTRRILVVLAMVPALAQAAEISVGTFELTGSSSLGFSSGSTKVTAGGITDTTDNTDYSLSAGGLYYVTPNVGVGLSLDYTNTEDTYSDGTKLGVSGVLVGPAVGVAFPIQEKLYVVGQGTLAYASVTVSQTGQADEDRTGWGFQLRGGLRYFVAKSFSFDAGLMYRYTKVSRDLPFGGTEDTKISSFGLGVGLSVYFGGA